MNITCRPEFFWKHFLQRQLIFMAKLLFFNDENGNDIVICDNIDRQDMRFFITIVFIVSLNLCIKVLFFIIGTSVIARLQI